MGEARALTFEARASRQGTPSVSQLATHGDLLHIRQMNTIPQRIRSTIIVLAALAMGFAGTVAQASEANLAIQIEGSALDPGESELTHTTPAYATKTDSAPVVQPVAQAKAKAGDAFVIKRILPIEGPIRYGDWYWEDEGVPPGKLVMTVDLDARVLSVFRDGFEIGATAVLLGTDEHPTPLGTFPILTKERHNVSEKYDNAPMPWTLRLTWDGIAIHGGSEIVNGYASHGCIAVPDEFAARLFDIARKGDKVVITRGRMIGLGDSVI